MKKIKIGFLPLYIKLYDDKDNLIELALFDAEGKPTTNSYKIHKYTQKFNNRNQCIEICYYNTKGELTSFSNHNYCIKRSEFDEKGQVVKESYFDKNNQPAIYYGDNDGHYSICTIEYDQYGRIIRNFYFSFCSTIYINIFITRLYTT